ncbi:MAG: bifunctional 3-phenylpropionate/cinnamic acid dioxygenase ferredoxin subunit [Novosphingobium sp.]|nr:bifunctional 3-phenylpropionate/cinnamic acid dioxygenase ferredoxin subunit [Novosphingobium sp.]
MATIKLCKAADVSPGNSLRIEPENLPPLAVFNVEGEFYVINDTCSHGDASLCDGEIEDGEVECPWHNAKFCIKTGKALTFPAVEPQQTYKTAVIDGEVCIDI